MQRMMTISMELRYIEDAERIFNDIKSKEIRCAIYQTNGGKYIVKREILPEDYERAKVFKNYKLFIDETNILQKKILTKIKEYKGE